MKAVKKPLKPTYRPHFMRLPEVKRMTIAAGFNCKDGIVLCSDTEETRSEYLKVSVPKLVIRPDVKPGDQEPTTAYKLVFAGAGHGPFIDKLTDGMWRAAKVIADADGTLEDVVNAIEDANIAIHQKFWTLYEKDVKPEANILCAISVRGEMELLKASGPLMVPVDTFESTGCGYDLATYIATGSFKSDMPARQAAILALYVLAKTKEHVPGCGGDSQLVILRPNAKHEYWHGPQLSGPIMQLSFLDGFVKEILISSADVDSDEEMFKRHLQGFLGAIDYSRTIHRRNVEEYWARLEQHLRESGQAITRAGSMFAIPDAKKDGSGGDK